MQAQRSLLEVSGATKRFSGLTAVRNVNMEVESGEIVGLIGPNGAGKTTLFNCISGFYKLTSGEVIFRGHRITGLRPDLICRAGIARTFQIPRPLAGMTVLENAMVAAFVNAADSPGSRRNALEAVEFCGLRDMRDTLSDELTVAMKKRLELARAMATRPQLLMLDEAMAGLNPSERKEAVGLILRIREELGMTVLIIEHIMDVIMPICDRLVVLNHGEKIADGSPSLVCQDHEVLAAYLGAGYNARAN